MLPPSSARDHQAVPVDSRTAGTVPVQIVTVRTGQVRVHPAHPGPGPDPGSKPRPRLRESGAALAGSGPASSCRSTGSQGCIGMFSQTDPVPVPSVGSASRWQDCWHHAPSPPESSHRRRWAVAETPGTGLSSPTPCTGRPWLPRAVALAGPRLGLVPVARGRLVFIMVAMICAAVVAAAPVCPGAPVQLLVPPGPSIIALLTSNSSSHCRCALLPELCLEHTKKKALCAERT